MGLWLDLRKASQLLVQLMEEDRRDTKSAQGFLKQISNEFLLTMAALMVATMAPLPVDLVELDRRYAGITITHLFYKQMDQ